MPTKRSLVAIVGPTASGKSELGLLLATRHGGEIINCDSLQMYRYFDIGTAKSSMAERERVPHHFVDVLNPDEQFAAGEYMRQARECLDEVSARGHLPIVVGGTGFYLRALIDGLFVGPGRDPELRARLTRRSEQKSGEQKSGEQRGSPYLHRLLRRMDTVTAEQIHPNDTAKLIRAIELCLLSRRPASELFREGRSRLEGYQVVKVGLSPPRDALYEKINQRTRQMFDQGLVEEVQSIFDRGYGAGSSRENVPPLGSHGYRQAVDFLEGRISLDEALYHAQTRTRQYAKRQMTWFRKEAGVRWFDGFGDSPEIQSAVCDFVSGELDSA